MKANKWLLLFLAVCLVFSLAACDGGGGSGESAIPVSDNYLCFKANENNCSISTTIYFSLIITPSLEYSTDKENWAPFIIDSTTVDLTNAGDKVYIRATSANASFSDDDGWITFETSKSVSASGNIMSLLDKNCGGNSVPDNAFRYLFYNATLTTAPELPATTLGSWCYESMFEGCSFLTTAPELPATSLAERCYEDMFRNCSSLTTVPALPATTLAEGCYSEMFYGCSSLTMAPALPATTLASWCYDGMFSFCSSLTTAPVLLATTLVDFCYAFMFEGCSFLTTAPELPAIALANNCYRCMFNGCSRLSSITVYFTTWDDSYTFGWVDGVAASGQLHCPEDLPDEVDYINCSKKPGSWTKVPLP